MSEKTQVRNQIMFTKNRMRILAKMCGSMTDHQNRINLLIQLNFILNYIRFLPNQSSNLNSYFILIKFQKLCLFSLPRVTAAQQGM